MAAVAVVMAAVAVPLAFGTRPSAESATRFEGPIKKRGSGGESSAGAERR
jgi:hypothetical protein